MQTSGLTLETPALARAVEQLSEAQIDTLPFGVIRLAADGRVLLFNATERATSGYRRETINRSFFMEIAPCLSTPRMKGRIDAALEGGTLDMTIEEVVDLPAGAKDVEMRIRVQSSSGGGIWIFTQRLD